VPGLALAPCTTRTAVGSKVDSTRDRLVFERE
jgi:hypothetical protein